jgi:release factor glutamine methyltransferase
VQRTALELARQAGEFLGERGIENGRLEAELLLAGLLGLRRLDLYLQ